MVAKATYPRGGFCGSFETQNWPQIYQNMDKKQIYTNIKNFMKPGIDSFCYIKMNNGSSRILAHSPLDMPTRSLPWPFRKLQENVGAFTVTVSEVGQDLKIIWRETYKFSMIDKAITHFLSGLPDEEISKGFFMLNNTLGQSRNLLDNKGTFN